MSSCNTFPTSTRTDEVVSSSLSFTTTTHVTTLPPSTTTIILTPACSMTPCTPITTTSEIPGGVSAVVETVTVTVPITTTQITTLWGTSCTPTGSPDPPTDISSSPPSTSESRPPQPVTSTRTWTPSYSTPSPTVFVTAWTSTQADGYVTPVTLTVTSTLAPVLVSQSPSADAVTNEDDSRNSKNLGPIIGGVVGAVAGVAVIAFIVWFIIRRKRRWDDIFNDDDDVAAVAAAAKHNEKQIDPTPKPYQYGLVGHTKGQSLTTPPGSPPPMAASFSNEIGMEPAHRRNTSVTPLLSRNSATSPSPRPPSASSLAYAQPDTSIWDPNALYSNSIMHQPLVPIQSAPSPPAGHPIPIMNAASAMMARVSPDLDSRVGSPVSFLEPRMLHVTNTGPHSPQSPTETVAEPVRDGKGRVVARGEGGPFVHRDGGRYQEPGSSTAAAASGGPAPPAYSE